MVLDCLSFTAFTACKQRSPQSSSATFYHSVIFTTTDMKLTLSGEPHWHLQPWWPLVNVQNMRGVIQCKKDVMI